MKLVPYLNFNGNCRAAFQYYEKHLGGKTITIMTHSEAPTGMPLPPDWGDAVLHGHMAIGESELMASDIPPDRQKPMRSMYLHLTVSGPEEAERVFKVLSQGGETYMPLAETFWASRFGILRDQFGALWMISAERPTS